MTTDLKTRIIAQAHTLGFSLVGVTTPEPPPHYAAFEHWLTQGHHGTMRYLAEERSRTRRADPKQILPECRSILVLATPYTPTHANGAELQIAAYARGADYHDVLPARMQALVQFIEEQTQGPVKSRWYTDTGPLLERDLAQRAGLGWVGRNSCLINPKQGSTFFLSEILLDLELEPDPPFTTDHCGTCTRCITACPTDCILPDRTLDARRCISYLTIELKDDIPLDLRDKIRDWVFGCDICQQVCPWNRFAPQGDPAFADATPPPTPEDLTLTPQAFNQRFKRTPLQRTKRRGYLRNLAVTLGNSGDIHHLPMLQQALNDPEPMIREHAHWAIAKLTNPSITQSPNGSITQ